MTFTLWLWDATTGAGGSLTNANFMVSITQSSQ
jgi:hypothetical protein